MVSSRSPSRTALGVCRFINNATKYVILIELNPATELNASLKTISNVCINFVATNLGYITGCSWLADAFTKV